MASDVAALEAHDLQLLDRLAGRLIELRLEVPALLALETGRPLSVLAGQTMIFFEPFVQAMFSLPDYRRFAALVERREALDALALMIERRADDAQRVRAEARARARAARAGDTPARPRTEADRPDPPEPRSPRR